MLRFYSKLWRGEMKLVHNRRIYLHTKMNFSRRFQEITDQAEFNPIFTRPQFKSFLGSQYSCITGDSC